MKYVLSLLLMLIMSAPALAEASFEEAVALFEDKEFKSAREVAEPLANDGDARAMAMMGALYQMGSGVKPDLEKAVSWFTKAAEKGHPGAQFSLAMLYLDGSLGNPDAENGAKWLEKAAAGGNAQAQYNLGLLYTGIYGTAPDWPKAAEWFKKSADQGFAEAQYNLGLLYLQSREQQQRGDGDKPADQFFQPAQPCPQLWS